MDYKKYIHTVEDFPKKGISFKDISPLLNAPDVMDKALNEFYNYIKNRQIDAIIGIESRGFIFGPLLANKLKVGFIMARKAGKLPPPFIKTKEYELEYASASLHLPTTCLKPGMRIHIHDDVLATGGTIKSVIDCLEEYNCIVDSISFVLNLTFLKGLDKISQYSVYQLISY